MKKRTTLWKISGLIDRYDQIDFPDYQREPTVWGRGAKQLLIDSILRGFDISAIYLYRHEDAYWDCVDGRQRLSAILSFLDENTLDENDNGFKFVVRNEIYPEASYEFSSLDDKRYKEIESLAEKGNDIALAFVEKFWEYKISVVELSSSRSPDEFNLQFTRLNLGQMINSAERLHAMVGDLRDMCFEDLGKHPFLSNISIPTRRFAREQLLAQIIAQIFTFEMSREFDTDERQYARVRQLDLQHLFHQYVDLGENEKLWLSKLDGVFEVLNSDRRLTRQLGSRAIVLSIVLFAYEFNLAEVEKPKVFLDFARTFSRRLRTCVKAGLDVEDEYRYLIDFHKYLTQASSEKYSVKARSEELSASYSYWKKNKKLKGD